MKELALAVKEKAQELIQLLADQEHNDFQVAKGYIEHAAKLVEKRVAHEVARIASKVGHAAEVVETKAEEIENEQ